MGLDSIAATRNGSQPNRGASWRRRTAFLLIAALPSACASYREGPKQPTPDQVAEFLKGGCLGETIRIETGSFSIEGRLDSVDNKNSSLLLITPGDAFDHGDSTRVRYQDVVEISVSNRGVENSYAIAVALALGGAVYALSKVGEGFGAISHLR